MNTTLKDLYTQKEVYIPKGYAYYNLSPNGLYRFYKYLYLIEGSESDLSVQKDLLEGNDKMHGGGQWVATARKLPIMFGDSYEGDESPGTKAVFALDDEFARTLGLDVHK